MVLPALRRYFFHQLAWLSRTRRHGRAGSVRLSRDDSSYSSISPATSQDKYYSYAIAFIVLCYFGLHKKDPVNTVTSLTNQIPSKFSTTAKPASQLIRTSSVPFTIKTAETEPYFFTGAPLSQNTTVSNWNLSTDWQLTNEEDFSGQCLTYQVCLI